MELSQIIKRPLLLTEKGNIMREKNNTYLFEVSPDANRIEIKKAVEKFFKVTVKEVRTLIVRGRMRRMGRGYAKTRNWKKAIVALKDGDSIDFTQG